MKIEDILISIGIGIFIALLLRQQQTPVISQPVQYVPPPAPPINQPCNTCKTTTISQPQSTGSFYKNDEKWEIQRNADGYIQNINIKRDAKTG